MPCFLGTDPESATALIRGEAPRPSFQAWDACVSAAAGTPVDEPAESQFTHGRTRNLAARTERAAAAAAVA